VSVTSDEFFAHKLALINFGHIIEAVLFSIYDVFINHPAKDEDFFKNSVVVSRKMRKFARNKF
jgi:hypothetical protein